MGWASGSHILREIWKDVREHLPEDRRIPIFGKIANVIWDGDCDTLCELIDDWPEVEPALIQIGYLEKDWREDY